MPKYEELESPLDDLDKSTLEQLKLKTEIINLRSEIKEKNRNWFVKNLSLLIPSVIGFFTVLTAYLTGFFNVQNVRLENQKHDLIAQVDSFTQKKDKLFRTNDSLLVRNTILEKDYKKMKDDTLFLSETVKFLKIKSDSILLQNHSLNEITSKLKIETSGLKDNVNVLKSDVSHAAFNEYFKNITEKPDIGYEYGHLLMLMNKNGEKDNYYYQNTLSAIDSTKDIFLKAVLLRLMYEHTSNQLWKQKLFATGDEYCDMLSKEKGKFSSGESNYFLRLLDVIIKDEDITGKLGYIKKILSRLKNIRQSNVIHNDIANILEFTTKQASSDYNQFFSSKQDFQFYKTYPDFFCYFMTYSIDFCLNDTLSILPAEYSFIKKFAPIAFACLESEMVKKSNFNQVNFVQNLGNLSLMRLGIPTNKSTELWRAWQNKNNEIVEITLHLNKYCGNGKVIEKIVGTSPF